MSTETEMEELPPTLFSDITAIAFHRGSPQGTILRVRTLTNDQWNQISRGIHPKRAGLELGWEPHMKISDPRE